MDVMGLKPDGYLLKSMSSDAFVQSIDDFFEKSLDNWYTSFYIILNPYQTDRKYMNLGKRRTT